MRRFVKTERRSASLPGSGVLRLSPNTTRLAILAVVVSTGYLNAASLDMYKDLPISPSGLVYGVHLVPATGTDRVTYSGSKVYAPVPGRRSAIDYSSSASMGSLGMAFSVSAQCDIPGCGSESLSSPGVASASSDDILTITGAASGFLGLNIYLQGFFSPDNVATSKVVYCLQTFSSRLEILTATFSKRSTSTTSTVSGTLGNSMTGNFADFAPIATGTGWTVNLRGTVFVPFSSVPITLYPRLQGDYNCSATIGRACTATANFPNGARIGEAVVYDTNMNRVSGAVVSSASGFDYSAPVSRAPEPARLLLCLTGVLCIGRKDGLIQRFAYQCDCKTPR